MDQLEKRKLLILGGRTAGSYDIVSYAKRLGAYVIVTDFLNPEDSPAKQIADEIWNVSTADVDKIANKAKEQNVNAVFAGIHEFNLERALSVCEKLGLPFYASRNQLELTTNKAKWKQLFTNFNIPVVEEHQILQSLTKSNFSGLTYPVIVKPVDRSGGLGISICENELKLKEGCRKALSFSSSGRVIVEQYVTGEEVTVFYAIQDGHICLTAVADRHVQHFQKDLIPLPVAYIFPSKYLRNYQESLNERVIEAFEAIKLKNGMLFLQALVKNGEFYTYDVGFRLSGTQEYHIFSKACGINTLEMMVNHALNGKMNNIDIRTIANPVFKEWYCNLTFLAKPGKIGKFEGTNKVKTYPEVIAVVPAYKEGDKIPESATGTLKQIILRIFVVTTTKKELIKVIDKIQGDIHVFSAVKKNMLISKFDTKKLID